MESEIAFALNRQLTAKTQTLHHLLKSNYPLMREQKCMLYLSRLQQKMPDIIDNFKVLRQTEWTQRSPSINSVKTIKPTTFLVIGTLKVKMIHIFCRI